MLIRLSNVESANRILQQQNDRLTHENADLNDRLTHTNNQLMHTDTRLTQENNRLAKKINALEQENSRINDELLNMKYAIATDARRNVTSSDSEPNTRAQFTAFACTNDIVTLSCPGGRTILTVSANYGQYSDEVTECTDCCAPNPESDCIELVEENRPSDWLAIQALCDNKTFCQFENLGSVVNECEVGYVSDYIQLFYTGLVARHKHCHMITHHCYSQTLTR